MLKNISSTYKYAKISPYKLRIVASNIRKRNAISSLDYLQFSTKKAAALLYKTLQSALANAKNNFDIDASNLQIKEVLIDEGPTAKRFRARARGRGARILKRSSHIKITLG